MLIYYQPSQPRYGGSKSLRKQKYCPLKLLDPPLRGWLDRGTVDAEKGCVRRRQPSPPGRGLQRHDLTDHFLLVSMWLNCICFPNSRIFHSPPVCKAPAENTLVGISPWCLVLITEICATESKKTFDEHKFSRFDTDHHRKCDRQTDRQRTNFHSSTRLDGKTRRRITIASAVANKASYYTLYENTVTLKRHIDVDSVQLYRHIICWLHGVKDCVITGCAVAPALC